MSLTRHLLDQVEFTPDEVSHLGLRDEGNGVVRWDTTKATVLEIDITKETAELLRQAVSRADREERVTLHMLPLIDQIEAL